MEEKIRCSFCSSEDIYHARHDSDWGSGNSFFPKNGQEDKEINVDIKTLYCNECGSLGDFEEINDLVNQE